MSMMSKYMNFLNKYTDAMSDLEDIDKVNLSAADYAYYVEVYGRIMQKLLKNPPDFIRRIFHQPLPAGRFLRAVWPRPRLRACAALVL